MQSCLELFILPDTLRDNLYSLSISQQVRDLTPQEYDIEFRSLQYALFSSCFFQVLSRWYQTRMLFFSWNFIQIFQYGFYVVASIWSRMCNWCKQSFQIFGGFFFLWMSFYVLKDKAKAEEESMLLEENQQQVWQPIQQNCKILKKIILRVRG